MKTIIVELRLKMSFNGDDDDRNRYTQSHLNTFDCSGGYRESLLHHFAVN